VLSKFERFNRRLSGWCEWLGVAAMLLMMVITCTDVAGAKVFLSPLLGAIDIVMLAQVVAISFAASMALIIGRHIQVEFFFNLLPRRAQAIINSVVSPWLGALHSGYLASLCAGSFLSNLRRV
jgi:TRAP-type C4-dicarboxylate transport system permease small subunit